MGMITQSWYDDRTPQGKYGVFGNAHRDKGYVLDAVEEVSLKNLLPIIRNRTSF